MRTAKDGKLFDIDNFAELREGEVEIIQYLRPNGIRRRMTANIGKENAIKAKDLIISAEALIDGKVAIYISHVNDPKGAETLRLAENGPGESSPTNVLIKMINEFDRAKPKEEKSPDE